MKLDFLTNWQFWSSVAAFGALALSQLPPVRLWFKKPSLLLEIQSSIYVTHQIGIPFLQIYVSLINTGGRPVRVREIRLSVSRTGQEPITLPIQGVFSKPNDSQAVFFVPISIRPGGEWNANCNFFASTTREQERQFREAKSALQLNIYNKVQTRRNLEQMRTRDGVPLPVGDGLIEADEEFVTPFRENFAQNFSLVAGEYQMTVTVVADSVNISNNYSFTLFESDENDLRNIVDDYKFGTWIYFDDSTKTKFFRIPLRETT